MQAPLTVVTAILTGADWGERQHFFSEAEGLGTQLPRAKSIVSYKIISYRVAGIICGAQFLWAIEFFTYLATGI